MKAVEAAMDLFTLFFRAGLSMDVCQKSERSGFIAVSFLLRYGFVDARQVLRI